MSWGYKPNNGEPLIALDIYIYIYITSPTSKRAAKWTKDSAFTDHCGDFFFFFFTLIYLAYYAYLETHSHLQLPNTQIIKILKEYIYRLILNTMLLLLCNFQDLRNGLKISLLPMESVSLLLTSYRAKHHMTRGWSRSPWSTTRPPASIFSTTGIPSKWPSRTTPTAQVSVNTTSTNKFTTVQVLIQISRRKHILIHSYYSQ